MNEEQKKMHALLSELSGEQVLNLLLDYHSTSLLDDGFKEHLVDEGYLEEEEEDEEDEEDYE